MESTGREHCIHASQETADILTALGKGFWVHPREDKIHAKGKGELQTYWIKPMGLVQSTMDDRSSGFLTDENEDGMTMINNSEQNSSTKSFKGPRG
jgi:Adenylate and Guanylate cyclase catalytic domain